MHGASHILAAHLARTAGSGRSVGHHDSSNSQTLVNYHSSNSNNEQRTRGNVHNDSHRTITGRTDEGSLSQRLEGLSVGNTSQMASPSSTPARTGGSSSSTAGPGWRPPPSALTNGQSLVSSIPLLREEAAMMPIRNHHHGNTAASSPINARKPPIPDGGSPSGTARGVGERGRRGARNEGQQRRGSRSSSAGRARSRDRGNPESSSSSHEVQ